MSQDSHVRLGHDAKGSPAIFFQRKPPDNVVPTSCFSETEFRANFVDAPVNRGVYDMDSGRVLRRVPTRDAYGNFTVLLADGPFAREARWFHSNTERLERLFTDRAATLRTDGFAVLWTRSRFRREPLNIFPCRDTDGNLLHVFNCDLSRVLRSDGVPATSSSLPINSATWQPELVKETNIRLPADENRAAALLADVFWNEMNPFLPDPFVTEREYDAFAEGEDRTDEPLFDGGTGTDHLFDVLRCLFAVHIGFPEGVEEIKSDVIFATHWENGRVNFKHQQVFPESGMMDYSSLEFFNADAASLIPKKYRFDRANTPNSHQTTIPISPRHTDFRVLPARTLDVSLTRPTSHRLAKFLNVRRHPGADDAHQQILNASGQDPATS